VYYVNREQIDHRLNALPDVADALEMLAADWQGTVLQGLAQERSLHLAVEIVTDVGSYLIDGFIMRDPGSYTDIVDILQDEQVLDAQTAGVLTKLVAFRKQLVHHYTDVPHAEMIRLVRDSLDSLARFAPAVRRYIQQELF